MIANTNLDAKRRCKKCGRMLNKISPRCWACGTEYDHRACYPEQYAHPLCGKKVRVGGGGPTERAEGVVVRVVATSEAGEFAYLDNSGDIGYRASDCVPQLQLFSVKYHRKHPTTGAAGFDKRWAWVSAECRGQVKQKLSAADPHLEEVITCDEPNDVTALDGAVKPLRVF